VFDWRVVMVPMFRVPTKCPTMNQLQALDQQIEIDMQQEKVTDNK
jgi:hypothetical protein